MPRHVAARAPLALLTILAGALVTAPALAGTAPSARAPMVRTEQRIDDHYYDVRGTTPDEVFASIKQKGLGGVPGRAASGVTRANLSASMDISSTPDGPCRIEALAVTLTLDVTLPRHAGARALDQRTRENWEVYATGVEAHEYEHVGIEEQGLREVKTKLERVLADPTLPGPGPEPCRRLIDEVLALQRRETDARHQRFHEQEARWLRDSQHEVRGEIEGMDRRLAEHAARLGALDQRLAALRAEQAMRDAELQVLVGAFGTRLPEPQFSQATALQAAVAELGSAIALQTEAREATAEEHRRLAEVRRQRADDLSWIR
jgi:predicted secreted Zn-dependent protease